MNPIKYFLLCIFWLPSYLVGKLVIMIRKDHPWRKDGAPMWRWVMYGTTVSRDFCATIWVASICTALVLYRLYTLRHP